MILPHAHSFLVSNHAFTLEDLKGLGLVLSYIFVIIKNTLTKTSKPTVKKTISKSEQSKFDLSYSSVP